LFRVEYDIKKQKGQLLFFMATNGSVKGLLKTLRDNRKQHLKDIPIWKTP
jgi:hypothetical protein